MTEEKRIFVSIYCKVFTDSFSDEMVNRRATGAEIFKFLMKDAGLSFDEEDHLIPGDCNLGTWDVTKSSAACELKIELWNGILGNHLLTELSTSFP